MADFVTDNFVAVAGTALTAHTPDLGGPITVYPAGGTSTTLINPSGQAGATSAVAQISEYAAVPPANDYEVYANVNNNLLTDAATVGVVARIDDATTSFVRFTHVPSTKTFQLVEFIAGVQANNSNYTPSSVGTYPLTISLRTAGQLALGLVNGAIVTAIPLFKPAAPGRAGVTTTGTGAPPYHTTLSAYHAATPVPNVIINSNSTLNFAVYTPATALKQASLTLWYPAKNVVLKGTQADVAAQFLTPLFGPRLYG